MRTWLLSLLTVVGSYLVVGVVVIALSFGSVAVMHVPFGHPTPAYLVVNVVYSVLAACLGGFLAARWAPRQPFLHAAAMAGLMLIVGLCSLPGPHPGQPAVYLVAMSVLCPAAVLLTGWRTAAHRDSTSAAGRIL